MRPAGASLLVVGGDRKASQSVASALAPLLEAKLGQVRDVSPARARTERLDGLAWTAHELMAPLIAARAALDHLSAGADEGHRGETLGEVASVLDELVEMCDDLLRWTVGAARPGPDLVDVHDVVQEAIGTCRLEGRQERVAVAVQPGARVEADRMELRIAIANLIRNALAYSPPGGAVTVSLEKEHEIATITVEDEGPGVQEEERDRIFDAFVRGSAADHARSGRGLGLFIARRVIDTHGGSIWVEPGRSGAAFKLSLPVAGGAVDSCAS
jgi:signal transduction histidine kinase